MDSDWSWGEYILHKECGLVLKCDECEEPAVGVDDSAPKCGEHQNRVSFRTGRGSF